MSDSLAARYCNGGTSGCGGVAKFTVDNLNTGYSGFKFKYWLCERCHDIYRKQYLDLGFSVTRLVFKSDFELRDAIRYGL